MRTAPQTLQLYLDEVGAAVMKRDFAAYRERMCLPFHLVTHTTTINVTTEDQLRLGFQTFADTLAIERVTDYLRLVEGAEMLDDALLTGRYITHMLAGGHRVIPPFRSHITLRLEDGRWCCAAITNALANSRWPILVSSPRTQEQEGPDQ